LIGLGCSGSVSGARSMEIDENEQTNLVSCLKKGFF
jgi:hypothetical protein